MLQVSGINKSYGDKTILRDVSLTVNAGERLGLIGPNGCGKTTLLRIITGEERPDSGSVRHTVTDLRMGYLTQGLVYKVDDTLADYLQVSSSGLEDAERRVVDLAEQMAVADEAEAAALANRYHAALVQLEQAAAQQRSSHNAQAILAGLGLGSTLLETAIDTLSGGQKTRLGLARILVDNPQLLLLDEPTNHLDIQALEWLEDWLDNYRGAILVVSHDRTFLDRTVSTILELDPFDHGVSAYPGSFTDYVEAKVRQREKQWSAYKQQQERVARLGGEILRLGEYAGRIERGTIDYSVRKIAKGIARRATVQKRRLERELAEERLEKPKQSWQIKLEFKGEGTTGRDVLILDELSAGYDGVELFGPINQVLRAGERVALTGPNGAGKTTLLRVITGELAPLAGHVRLGSGVKLGYYAQEQEELDPDGTPFDAIRQIASMSETDTRSFLHFFLFAGDEAFARVGDLSYGERARLALARLVAQGCNFLLLDEPINHLDIPSRAQFEQAMSAFDGTVLAIVHDRYFIRQFASRIWVMADGSLRNHFELPGAGSGQLDPS